MSNSFHVQIADAVVTEINDVSRTWNSSFTATREWAKDYSASDLATLQVKVVPLQILAEATLERGGREKFDYELAVDFQQMFTDWSNNNPGQTTFDALDKIIQDVHDFYRDGHTLSLTPRCTVMDAKRPALFDEALLYSQNTFESTIFLTVRVAR